MPFSQLSWSDLIKRDFTGEWLYHAGIVGNLSVPVSERVVGIIAYASNGGASFTINGGDIIPIPTNVGVVINPRGILEGPVEFVFTATELFFVETVRG